MVLKRIRKYGKPSGQSRNGSVGTAWALFSMGLVFLFAPMARATHEHPHVYHLADKCSLTIEGSATLRDWECSTLRFKGQVFMPVELDEIQAFFDKMQQGKSPSTDVLHDWTRFADGRVRAGFRANIDALDCGNSRMENDLQNALKHHNNPEIIYEFIHLAGISLLHGHGRHEDCIVLITEGHLELAGVIKKVIMNVHIARHNERKFEITATADMNMTDFGVEPPTALMGLIKAHDPVAISIRAILQ